MTQEEKRIYLIKYLIKERPGYYHETDIPKSASEQKRILRSLFNIRPPMPAAQEFLDIQDEYLKAEIADGGITDINELQPISDNLYLWRGDITTLKCGAIVNAANSQLLGCFQPCHGCIDNVIHTYAGVQLRLACADIMRKQGHEEKTGTAKITPAFNLPCDYVLHTVGPIVYGGVTKKEEEQLASCYRSCMELAEMNNVESVAFCCISTGVFSFPKERAAEIAVKTVTQYCKKIQNKIKTIFNVFTEEDYEIYKHILGAGRET